MMFGNPPAAMKTTLSLFWTLLALAAGTTLSTGQTNVFHSGNPRIDEKIRQFEAQSFVKGLPPKIQLAVLQRNLESLTLWVEGFPQSNPNAPDKLAGLDLEVWLLRNDGTAVAPIEKPWLDKGGSISFGVGNNEFSDSMVYTFTRIPVNELAGAVIRSQGKLFCYKVDQQKWKK